MNLLKAFKVLIKRIFKHLIKIRPQILFDAFNGMQYSDNPRAISEMMHKLYPQYKIVWNLNKGINIEIVPDYVICVSGGFKFFMALFSSICYVSNCEFHGLSKLKKKKQLYVQTWHADRYLKKVLYDADPKWAEESRMCDAIVTDIALAGSSFGIQTYREAFRYYGEVVNLGCPRNERMLNMSDEKKIQIKKTLGIGKEEKVFMYAPTFRDYQMKSQGVFIDVEKTRKVIEKRCGGSWKAIVRGHVGKHLSGFQESDNVRDTTQYPDMADLLAISDFLVTDYSSSVLDFYLTGKPIVLAIFDIDDYVKRCRGFKIDPRETSFICTYSQNELEKTIDSLNLDRFEEDYKKIDELFGTNETGESTEYICKYIDSFYMDNYVK